MGEEKEAQASQQQYWVICQMLSFFFTLLANREADILSCKKSLFWRKFNEKKKKREKKG